MANTSAIGRRQALELDKEAVLEQIRELDFDHETGKIAEEAYQPLRAQLAAEAAELLRELDTLAPAEDKARDLEVDIESAIAGARRPQTVASTGGNDDDIEALIARRRRNTAPTNGAVAVVEPPVRTAKKARFCSQCGESLDPDDRFCAVCGNRL